MSPVLQSKAVSIGLAVAGLAAWGVAGSALNSRGELAYKPNVLTLKGSPFGKTLAIAMQGPIDVYWHGGQVHDHDHSECGHDQCQDHDHRHDHQEADAQGELGQEFAELESLLEEDGATSGQTPSRTAIRTRLLDTIKEWRTAYYSRTNPRGNTEAHRDYIMRETERRLYLGYELDPTNYTCYGAYFLFLSESLAKNPDGLKQAERLAQYTVERCIEQQHNPQAVLTGAAAAHDVVQLRLAHQSAEEIGSAAQYIGLTSACLFKFDQLVELMKADGRWALLSDARRSEMLQRAQLIRNLSVRDREAFSRHAGMETSNEETLSKNG